MNTWLWENAVPEQTEEEAFWVWVENTNIEDILTVQDMGELLHDAMCGYDIRKDVDKKVREYYEEMIASANEP